MIDLNEIHELLSEIKNHTILPLGVHEVNTRSPTVGDSSSLLVLSLTTGYPST